MASGHRIDPRGKADLIRPDHLEMAIGTRNTALYEGLVIFFVLPSMAMASRGAPVTAATQATKQRWKVSESSVARMSPR